LISCDGVCLGGCVGQATWWVGGKFEKGKKRKNEVEKWAIAHGKKYGVISLAPMKRCLSTCTSCHGNAGMTRLAKIRRHTYSRAIGSECSFDGND